jgi:hypothetical protein
MRSDAVVIIGVKFQNPAQMFLAQDNDVVQTLAPDRSDQPFGNAARLDMFKEHCFLRFPDFGPSDGRYDVTRLLCVRLSQLRQSLRRDPPSAVLSNNATTARTIGIGGPGRTLVSSRWLPMRNQIDHVRADRRRGFCELTTTQAEFSPRVLNPNNRSANDRSLGRFLPSSSWLDTQSPARIALDKDVLPARTTPFESGLRAISRSPLLSASFLFPFFFCSMNHNHAKPSGAGGWGMMGGRAFASMDSGGRPPLIR